MENDKEKEMSIELKQEVAKGTYSNLAIISHSKNEVIIDFATMLPGFSRPSVTDRIIMTPDNAKRLLMLLQDNIVRYEAQYGQIMTNDTKTFTMGINNGGTKS